MKEQEQIKEQLTRFVGALAPGSIMQATVRAVNENDATCAVELPGGALLPDARLRAVIKEGSRFVLFPAVGSEVLVGRIQRSDEVVILATEQITKAVTVVGTSKTNIDATGILIAKGADGLREIITDLITEIQAIYAPKNVANIAAIQVRVNQLLKAV